MAWLIGNENIPEIGDVIKKMEMSTFDNILDIEFKSGKKVIVHISHEDVETLRKKYPRSK